MGTIQDTTQQIEATKSQLLQARQQAEQFNPQVELSARQLRSQTPTSSVKIQELQRQRGIAKDQALGQIESNEQQVQQFENEFNQYLQSDSGKIAYAKESGLSGEPIYDRVVKGGSIELVGYKYNTPYGVVEDRSLGNSIARSTQKAELQSLGFKNAAEYEQAQGFSKLIGGNNGTMSISETSEFAKNLASQGYDIKDLSLNMRTGQVSIPQLNQAIKDLTDSNLVQVPAQQSLMSVPDVNTLGFSSANPLLNVAGGRPSFLSAGMSVAPKVDILPAVGPNVVAPFDSSFLGKVKGVASNVYETTLVPMFSKQNVQETFSLSNLGGAAGAIASFPSQAGMMIGKGVEDISKNVLTTTGVPTTGVNTYSFEAPSRFDISRSTVLDYGLPTQRGVGDVPAKTVTLTDNFNIPKTLGQVARYGTEFGLYVNPSTANILFGAGAISGTATALNPQLQSNERVVGAIEAGLNILPFALEAKYALKAGELGLSKSELEQTQKLLQTGKVGALDSSGGYTSETAQYNQLRQKALMNLDKKYGALGAPENVVKTVEEQLPSAFQTVSVPTRTSLIYNPITNIREPILSPATKIEVGAPTKFISDYTSKAAQELEGLGIGKRIRVVEQEGAGSERLFGRRAKTEFESIANFAQQQGMITQKELKPLITEAGQSRIVSRYESQKFPVYGLNEKGELATLDFIGAPTRSGKSFQNVMEYSLKRPGAKSMRIQYVTTESPYTGRPVGGRAVIGLGGKNQVETSMIFKKATGRPKTITQIGDNYVSLKTSFKPEWQLEEGQQAKTNMIAMKQIRPGVVERTYKTTSFKPFFQPEVGKRVSALDFMRAARTKARGGLLPGKFLGNEYTTEKIFLNKVKPLVKIDVKQVSEAQRFAKNLVGFEYVKPARGILKVETTKARSFLTQSKTSSFKPGELRLSIPRSESPAASIPSIDKVKSSGGGRLRVLEGKGETLKLLDMQSPATKSAPFIKPTVSKTIVKATGMKGVEAPIVSIYFGKGLYEKTAGGLLPGEISVKTTGPQKVMVAPRQSLIEGTSMKEDLASDTAAISAVKLDSLLRLDTIQSPAQDQVQRQGQDQISKIDSAFRLDTKLEGRQINRAVTTPSPPPFVPTTPRPPKIKLPYYPYNKPETKRFLGRATGKPSAKYIAELKRFRKFFAVGSASTPQEALNIAKMKARETLGASVRVRAPKGFLPVAPSEEFRLAKRDPFVLVQRKTSRISSFGEKKEIQQARKLSSMKAPKIKLKVFKYSKKGVF